MSTWSNPSLRRSIPQAKNRMLKAKKGKGGCWANKIIDVNCFLLLDYSIPHSIPSKMPLPNKIQQNHVEPNTAFSHPPKIETT